MNPRLFPDIPSPSSDVKLIPSLDLDSDNMEPLRLLIDRNNVGKITDAFPAKVWFQLDLRCLEYRVPVVGNRIDNLI